MVTDMTKGKPATQLLKFTLPILISMFFQQMYNMADSIIVGRFVGEQALAAVSASHPITMLFMAFAFGCNIGCSIYISQLFGAKKYNDMKTTISTSFISTITLSLILTIAGTTLCKIILGWLDTPANIMADSAVYLNVYTLGLFFLFLYNISTGVFTSLGDSKTPLYFLIVSSIINIVADVVFVVVFNKGVAGVAWATFFSQGLCAILAFATLIYRLRKLSHTGTVKFFSFDSFKKISLLSIPSIFQQSCISIGALFIQNLVNSFGSSVVAGYGAAIKLNTFTLNQFSALSNGLSSFTAQNTGANKQHRVFEGYKAAIKIAMLVGLPFVLLYTIYPKLPLMLFMNNDSVEALQIGVSFLRTISPFYFVILIKIVADGLFRGAGAMRCFTITTFIDLGSRVALAYIITPIVGSSGIWWSISIGWCITLIVTAFFLKKGYWNRDSMV